MAQINIGHEANPVNQDSIEMTGNKSEKPENPTQIIVDEDDNKILSPSEKITGLSPEELSDPNKITVTIADKEAPIVVLFGPPACGKTMTLIRLARFLRDEGYNISPIKTFRPSYDSNYIEICENFDVMLNQDDAAKSTSKISFMLVKVTKNGRTVCQILEAPGEYYFNPQAPKSSFPKYFNSIKNSKNRKIWAIMVEPDWKDEGDRLNYVDRIGTLRKCMTAKDKAIIIYNKIDKTDFLIDNSGNAHIGHARKNISDLYPQIFKHFENDTPIVSWFVPYKFDFTVFQTGDYSTAADGTTSFDQGPDVFPRKLWNIILKNVRG